MKKSIGSGRGSVYNILLKALQSGDKYGYEICKEIEEKSNGAYILKQPSLYSGLKRLEAQNLITSYWRDSDLGGRRHYYSLTDAGRQKIESSNFSWEDTRDNLVNSLFEKSEVENNIEEVTKQVDELTRQTQNSTEIQQDIDDIISSTQNLAEKYEEQETVQNTTDEETDPLFTYNQSDDLFSMFNNYSPKAGNDNTSENEQNLEESFITEQTDENIFEEATEEELYAEELENQTENNTENQEIEQDVKDGNIEIQDEQLDLFSFINTQQNNLENEQVETEQEIEEQEVEEEFDGVSAYEDIIKNFTTYQSTEQENTIYDQTENIEEKNDSTFEKFEDTELEKLVDAEEQDIKTEDENFDQKDTAECEQQSFEATDIDYLQQYRNNRQNSSSFVDNSKAETVEKSFFGANFDNQTFDLENTNFDFSTINPKQEDINNYEVKSDDQNIEVNDIDEQSYNDEVETKNETIDYRNIFGDLMTSNTQSIDSQNEEPETFTNNENNLEKNDIEPTNRELQDDLPRVNLNNNINRTLVVDEQMIEEINQHYYEENPFEKLDQKRNEDSFAQEQNLFENNNQQLMQGQSQKNIPFDKKYNNVFNYFEVPDYQVRYYKKPTNHSVKESKFISINKLNLVSNIILCILMCIFTTTALICSSKAVDITTTQTVFYVFSFVLAVGIVIFHFLKYIANKNKKAIGLNKHETMYNSFFAVVIIILSVAINILFGMNLTNILNYSATFILPVCFAVLLMLAPFVKKFLSKFSSFYVN